MGPNEMSGHPFFSGEPGPPGTEHLWGDYEYDMNEMDEDSWWD